MVVFKSGSPTWARTRDLRINSPSLYRLSYRGKILDYRERSNLRQHYFKNTMV